ncbi:hypothetical protein [Deinococcus sp. AJ005]|uniref:hypothetical protein n=1 Tax=Deinococcus sp. AJ005 TaxID=2652443 RepID=UPI00125CB288|nr:hypothetical protein [Deinococcus sp. AJ005]QFP77643.1 hypothetical protein DAAJ005_15185 [Deinococcus sp. AJ005]
MHRFFLRLCALLVLLHFPAHATNFTYGAWTFTLPEGARESVQDGIRAFGYDNAVYLFTPPEPLGGRTLEAVAAATMKDITQNNAGQLQAGSKRTAEGGLVILPFTGAVTDPRTGQSNIQTYFFFAKNDQWGLALLMMNAGANAEEAMAPLGSVQFSPDRPSAQQNDAPTPPRLPALPWATPAQNRTVSSVPGMDFPAARKKGLDPKHDLLPDVFDCYFVGEYSGDDVRAMSPTPDLRLQVSASGTYALNDGAARSSGRWTTRKEGGKTRSIGLEGPITNSRTYINGMDSGQEFNATHAASKRDVRCYQAGPGAELLRLELTRKRIGNETLTCQDAGGGAPYTLTFGDGTYSTPRGSGRTRLGLSGSGSGWQGLARFTGGPFDLSAGEMTEDTEGNRTLSISEKMTESRGFWYTSTTTTPIALCRAKTTPKPAPIYGRSAAPRTGLKGGPDGLFVSLQNHPYMSGLILLQNYQLELSLFRPDGYLLADIDPTQLGGLPDCARTKPNGDPFCDRYELTGGKLRMQDHDLTWNDAEAFKITPAGFTLGDTTYSRALPVKAADLAGVFSTEDFRGNGPIGGALGGGAGVYNSLSSGYQFTKNGKFNWKYSSTTTTLISPSLITGGGVSGGGGNTRRDGGQGSYSLKDNWLTLTFSDGRTQRLYVYSQPAADLKNDPTLGNRLNIGGTWLNRAPEK